MTAQQQLFKAFNYIEFIDESHLYINRKTGNPFKKSVTGAKKKFIPPVDWEYWKVYKLLQRIGTVKYRKDLVKHRSFEYNSRIIDFDTGFSLVDIEVINKEWKEKGDKGKSRGSHIHNYIENAWGGVFPEKRLPLIDKVLYAQFEKFSPIGIEVTVGDEGLDLAGRFDGLFESYKREVILRDTKTDKKFKKAFQNAKLLYPFDDLKASTLGEYTVQLNLYAFMIEKHTDIFIDRMYIDYFSPEGEYREINIRKIKLDYDTLRRIINP